MEYFKAKSFKDFKNAKKFSELYLSKIRIMSDKSKVNIINNVRVNGKTIDDKKEMFNLFNSFFTSISSSSFTLGDNSSNFIEN